MVSETLCGKNDYDQKRSLNAAEHNETYFMLLLQSSINCCQWSECKWILWLDKLLIQDLHNRTLALAGIHSKKIKMSRCPSPWLVIHEHWAGIFPPQLEAEQIDVTEPASRPSLYSASCLMTDCAVTLIAGPSEKCDQWRGLAPAWAWINSSNASLGPQPGTALSLCWTWPMDWYPPTAASRQIASGVVPLFQ